MTVCYNADRETEHVSAMETILNRNSQTIWIIGKLIGMILHDILYPLLSVAAISIFLNMSLKYVKIIQIVIIPLTFVDSWPLYNYDPLGSQISAIVNLIKDCFKRVFIRMGITFTPVGKFGYSSTKWAITVLLYRTNSWVLNIAYHLH